MRDPTTPHLLELLAGGVTDGRSRKPELALCPVSGVIHIDWDVG